MKTFELTSGMLTMGGVFYPKGYAFIMFPNAQDAEQVAQEVLTNHGSSAVVMFLTPLEILREIGKADGESDIELPSVGTEGATVTKYVELARQGHCALMVKVQSDEETERVMAAVRKVPFSYGQRYHLLAIEDLE
ncbi:MAG: RNA-binding protein [Burkholderiaceae bacterium]|nr:RNA-binding protein [Burkholderiaceae bacterium]